MDENLQNLFNVKLRFQPYIKKPDEIYTFIAPKNKNEYDAFIELVYRMPGLSLSSTLRNEEKVNKILENYYSNSELDVYIMSEDNKTPFIVNGSLKDYVRKMNIDFEI